MDPPRLRLCRDCLRKATYDSDRCPHCGSPRTISLEDAAGLDIAHVDCDAFYAAVEKRDDPSLNDKPLIVGGSGPRGVVATCCYIARTFGVRSAMPMSRARALCPGRGRAPARHGQICARGPRNSNADDGAHALGRAAVDRRGFSRPQRLRWVQRSGACGNACPLRPQASRSRSASRFRSGLSYCKFLAKLASELNKPRGFASLSREEAKAWLGSQSVARLWGVGRVGRERLERAGFRSIGDLQRIEEREAVLRLGEDGLRLWRLAQGRDDRAVSAERETKSVSSETTFDRDISDKAELTRILLAQCDRVATRLRKEGLAACGVTLKLRLADFSLRTRSRSGIQSHAARAATVRGGAAAPRRPARRRRLSPAGHRRNGTRAGRRRGRG